MPEIATVTLTNNETGEKTSIDTTEAEVEVIPKLSTFSLGDNSNSAEYEIFVPIPSSEITPFASAGGTKNSGGVTAKINADYTLNSKGDQIKVTKIYGSWVPSSSTYTVTNRAIGAHSSFVAGGQKLSKKPTSNSFSYNTGWGYNIRMKNGNAPRAWSDAVIKVSGMSSTHSLSVEVTF